MSGKYIFFLVFNGFLEGTGGCPGLEMGCEIRLLSLLMLKYIFDLVEVSFGLIILGYAIVKWMIGICLRLY